MLKLNQAGNANDQGKFMITAGQPLLSSINKHITDLDGSLVKSHLEMFLEGRTIKETE